MKSIILCCVWILSFTTHGYSQSSGRVTSFLEQNIYSLPEENRLQTLYEKVDSISYLDRQFSNKFLDTLILWNEKDEVYEKINFSLDVFVLYERTTQFEYEGIFQIKERVEDNLVRFEDDIALNAKAFTALGEYHEGLGQQDSALLFFEKSLMKAEESGDGRLLYEASHQLAKFHTVLGIYDRAIEFSIKALNLAESRSDSLALLTELNNTGVLFRDLKEYEKVEQLLKKLIDVSKSIDSKADMAFGYANLSVNFELKNQYDLAIQSADSALEISREIELEPLIGGALMIKSKALNKLSRFELSEQLLTEAENIAQKYSMFEVMSHIYIEKAEIARNRNQYASANLLLQQAMEIATRNKIDRLRIEIMDIMLSLFKQQGDLKNALEIFERKSELEDSVFNAQKYYQVYSLQTRYETKEKEELIAAQQHNLELQTARNTSYIIALIGFSLIVIILVYLFIVSKRSQRLLREQHKKIVSQNNQLEQLNRTKDKFFSIIAHDLRSPMIALQGVGQKLDYFIRKDKRDKMLDMGRKIDVTIDNLNHLLNNLLHWATSQTQQISLRPKELKCADLIEEVVDLNGAFAESKDVVFDVQVKDEVVFGDYNTVVTTFRNVVSNAIKFTEPGTKITISVDQSETETFIKILDQGSGISDDQLLGLNSDNLESTHGTKGEKGFGLGLRLCKDFMAMNNGVFKMDNHPEVGTIVTMALPKNQPLHKVA